jgi:hypothetical protein
MVPEDGVEPSCPRGAGSDSEPSQSQKANDFRLSPDFIGRFFIQSSREMYGFVWELSSSRHYMITDVENLQQIEDRKMQTHHGPRQSFDHGHGAPLHD